MSYSHLDPGRELEICGHLYSNQMDLSELVQLPPAELRKREEASVEQEKAIYAKMLEIEKEWVQQAIQTLAFRKAQQYLKVPPTLHTSNKWVKGEYDWHEISNMVYKFTCTSTRIPAGAVRNKNPLSILMTCPGISPTTRLENQTILVRGVRLPGRNASISPRSPRWKDICKAVSKPTPICSQRFPHPFQRRKSAVSA